MKLLSVASEAFPLVKTGGLADVAGALPIALEAHGVATRTLLPGYRAVLAAIGEAPTAHRFDALAGGPARLLAASVAGLDVLVLDAPHWFDRDGGLYGFEDDARRFAALARVGARIGMGLLPDFVPDIVHAHDWQAGLVAAYLRYGGLHGDGAPRPGTVMTVHNLAFQGQFPAALLAGLELPPDAYTIEGVEYYGAIGFLKAGLQLSDRITTVSPTYAAEILSPALGMGMEGLLQSRADRVSGILNGIDTAVWNPATDAALAARYDARNAFARGRNKAALQARLGLREDPNAPLLALISRLSWQKGIDLVVEAAPAIRAMGAQLAILGAGDADLTQAIVALTEAAPGEIAAMIGYDETLAHGIQAGADALLVPSRFEPCGLTQLCALRYGAIPVVARTGGLADTVIDASPMALAAGVATGVQFAPTTAPMFVAAIRRAVALYRGVGGDWRRMQQNAMRADVSWADPARRYAALYAEILSARSR